MVFEEGFKQFKVGYRYIHLIYEARTWDLVSFDQNMPRAVQALLNTFEVQFIKII